MNLRFIKLGSKVYRPKSNVVRHWEDKLADKKGIYAREDYNFNTLLEICDALDTDVSTIVKIDN